MAVEAGGIGARLRAGREKLGLTVLQTAEKLHTDPRIVDAIEAEDFPALGAPIYARGHIKHYAELVGESVQELTALYASSSRVAQPDLTQIAKAPPLDDSSKLVAPALLVIGVFAVAGAIWWVSALSSKKPRLSETHVVGPLSSDSATEPASGESGAGAESAANPTATGSNVPPGSNGAASNMQGSNGPGSDASGQSSPGSPASGTNMPGQATSGAGRGRSGAGGAIAGSSTASARSGAPVPLAANSSQAGQGRAGGAVSGTTAQGRVAGAASGTTAPGRATGAASGTTAQGRAGSAVSGTTAQGRAGSAASGAAPQGRAAGAATVAAAQPRPAAAPSGAPNTSTVTLRYSADSWTEVYDASGTRLFYDVGAANTVQSFSGTYPLRVVLGNASGVSIEFNGRNESIANLLHPDGSAQFSINRSGRIVRARPVADGG